MVISGKLEAVPSDRLPAYSLAWPGYGRWYIVITASKRGTT